MQTWCILVVLIFPIALEGCCVGNNQKKRTAATGFTGVQWDTTYLRYRAVEGESFMMPCVISVNGHVNVVWSRNGDSTGRNEGLSFDCRTEFPAQAKHSGEYTYLTSGSTWFLLLQVVEKISLPTCFQSEESRVELLISAGGTISCPGRNCSDNTDVSWFKGSMSVFEQKRASCEEDGILRLCVVKGKSDAGVYFCDRQIIEQGVAWTFRRAVKVDVVPHRTTSNPPRIVYPTVNITEEVELGRPHTLICEVFFPYENKISAQVQWYMNYGDDKETQLRMEELQRRSEILEEYRVTERAIIKEVSPQHLSNTYTCIASNTVGNSSVTIKLKKKIKVKWPSLVGYPVVSLLLVAGLGIVLHVKWLEIQLIYRSNFQHGKHDGGEKEFDVFLSYVWSPPSAEVEGSGTVCPPPSRPGTDEKACLSSMDPLNLEEGESTQRPLEALLPKVLEEWWGYRLYLLERDMLPGGAYTNDVVLAIQRSQMLICVLSADYLCNSSAVFVLESGIQALLRNTGLKLLLIWTGRDSASLIQQDPQLPALVQRALKVLPSLNWVSGEPARVTCNFWRSLRKAMLDHRVKLAAPRQDQ